MDVVLYRVRGRNGYLYDFSFNPEIDYNILTKTRRIEKMEILSSEIPIEKAIEILKRLYGTTVFHGTITTSQNYLFQNLLKKYKVNKVRRNFEHLGSIPSAEDVSIIENSIIGKTISLKKIINIGMKQGITQKICIDIIQLLYCERRIKISSFLKEGFKSECSICGKEMCNICYFGFENDDILIYAADNYSVKEPKEVKFIESHLNIAAKNASKEIENFMKTKKQVGVLWCTPHSFDIGVFTTTIKDIISSGGKVLYITSTLKLMETKEFFSSKIVGAETAISNSLNNNVDILVCSYGNYECFYKTFDFVILDYTYTFVEKPAERMVTVSQMAVRERGKFILVTTCQTKLKSNILKGAITTIPLPDAAISKPMVEPRIIISRALNDVEPFIPDMAVELIKWSLSKEIKIIIFAPSEKVMKKVYYYLADIEKMNQDEIDVCIDTDKNPLIKFKRGQIKILISMDVKDALISMKDVNVVVMNSDDESFSEDVLINLAAVAGTYDSKTIDFKEALFVGSEESKDMSLAKESIRAINKLGWDLGYFKR